MKLGVTVEDRATANVQIEFDICISFRAAAEFEFGSRSGCRDENPFAVGHIVAEVHLMCCEENGGHFET